MSPHRDDGGAARREESSVVPPALELREVRKRFGTVEALKGASLTLRRGEVHALLGDNGAGKSTLLKIAAGVLTPDHGATVVNGEEIVMSSPKAAMQLGVETVYQDLALADDRSAVANIFMGRERLRSGPFGRLGVLDRPSMTRDVRDEFERLSISIADPTRPVRDFSGGQRQGIALARAAMWAKTIVLLDEPTAALGVQQRAMVHNLMNALRDRDLAVLLISHDVPEVLRIADNVTVLRLGRRIATRPAREVDTRWCVGAIVGEIDDEG